MKTPTLEDLQTMSEGEFQGIIQQAIEELDAEEQPENFEELELIAFIGGYGGELYRAIREQGIKTVDELLEARKKDPALTRKIAHLAITRAYPSYSKKGDA